MTAALETVHLSKSYRLGATTAPYETLRETIASIAGRVAGRHTPRSREIFWALDDVNITIATGEVVGIIGRNGAGKTTLLKLLSRITKPTRGRAVIDGRVGSLLEVGTGFHPELTGRENIFLNGAILGMRKTEIRAKLDEIVEFANVEQFLDTPVKRYSSGMYVRLAFSVAAHLEPEILLVDEVLAVGDAEFQRRCLGKMGSIAESGRTVVFVSHNMQTVTRLCERAILLDRGKVVDDGPADTVVAQYLKSDIGSPGWRRWTGDDAPGDDLVRLRGVRVVDPGGTGLDVVDVRAPVGIEIEFEVLRDGDPVRPAIMLVNEQGIHAFTAMNTDTRWREPAAVGRHVTTAWIPGNLLNEGLMTVTVFLSTLSPGKTVQHALERDVVAFQVTDAVEGDSSKGDHVGQWWGAVRPLLDWTSEAP